MTKTILAAPILLGLLLAPSAWAQGDFCLELINELGPTTEALADEVFAAVTDVVLDPDFNFNEGTCQQACRKARSGCVKVLKGTAKVLSDSVRLFGKLFKLGCKTLESPEKKFCRIGSKLAAKEVRSCFKLITREFSNTCSAEQNECAAFCLGI